MSGFAELFGFSTNAITSNALVNIYPVTFSRPEFIKTDVLNIFSRILTDTLERTQGVKEEQENLLWDNCVANESSDGLVTLLARAMFDKADLFLVYNAALGLIRKADSLEETKIRADYKEKGESPIGVYITFKNYTRSDMIKFYAGVEYSTVCSLSKQMALAGAIQLKLHKLRESVGLTDKADVVAQGTSIAEALQGSLDVMLDAMDSIETAKPDLTSTEASMKFINEKRSFYLGLPASWITGLAPKGLGDTGTGDAKQVERGLRNYFFSIIKPVLDELFEINVTFKSQDFEQIGTSLEALKSFELTSDELISQDNKRKIINKLFGLPESEKGDEPVKVDPIVDSLNPKPLTPKVANGRA